LCLSSSADLAADISLTEQKLLQSCDSLGVGSFELGRGKGGGVSVLFPSYGLLRRRLIFFEAYSCKQIWESPVKSNGFKLYLLMAEGI